MNELIFFVALAVFIVAIINLNKEAESVEPAIVNGRPVVPTNPGSIFTDYQYKYKTPKRVSMLMYKFAKDRFGENAHINEVAVMLDLHPNTARLIKKSRSLKHYRELRRQASKPEVYR